MHESKHWSRTSIKLSNHTESDIEVSGSSCPISKCWNNKQDKNPLAIFCFAFHTGRGASAKDSSACTRSASSAKVGSEMSHCTQEARPA